MCLIYAREFIWIQSVLESMSTRKTVGTRVVDWIIQVTCHPSFFDVLNALGLPTTNSKKNSELIIYDIWVNSTANLITLHVLIDEISPRVIWIYHHSRRQLPAPNSHTYTNIRRNNYYLLFRTARINKFKHPICSICHPYLSSPPTVALHHNRRCLLLWGWHNCTSRLLY